MTKDAFRYALKSVAPPSGRALWLYGENSIASGDIYHPWQGQGDIADINRLGRDYDAVFLNCPKQREESEGLLALAFERSRGCVMIAAANDAGGGRLLGMMKAYGVACDSLSKSHARIVWTMQSGKANRERIARDLAHLQPRQVAMEGRGWWTVPGLFGWDKIDHGSRLLLTSLPSDLSGRIADFGCGYGYLAASLEARYPAMEKIDAYDIDARAVVACAKNGGAKIQAIWQDIRTLSAKPLYDFIVMNPPFHSGKEENKMLGQVFISKAWESLKPGGRLFLVANLHLPYEKTVGGLSVIHESGGYKILTGRK